MTHENKKCTENCPCMEQCPLSTAMECISGKWKLRILCALYHDGKTRYNELKKKIPEITNTMLASSLKELENDRLIYRKQYAEMPVRVEYELTDQCIDLIPILTQLAKWGITRHGTTKQ